MGSPSLFLVYLFVFSGGKLLKRPSGSVIKNPAARAGDSGSIPGLRRSPGEGNGNPLQYSCLGGPMDRGTWWAIVHGVPKEPYMTGTKQQLYSRHWE